MHQLYVVFDIVGTISIFAVYFRTNFSGINR